MKSDWNDTFVVDLYSFDGSGWLSIAQSLHNSNSMFSSAAYSILILVVD